MVKNCLIMDTCMNRLCIKLMKKPILIGIKDQVSQRVIHWFLLLFLSWNIHTLLKSWTQDGEINKLTMYFESRGSKALYNNPVSQAFTKTSSAQARPNISNNNKTVNYNKHRRKYLNCKDKKEKWMRHWTQ